MEQVSQETKKVHMSKKKFRIGELAKDLQVKKFVIRFWEKEFELRSTRSSGGQRYYTEDDFLAFNTIKFLLYKQGFTIAGAKAQLEKMLRKHKGKLPLQPFLLDREEMASITKTAVPKKEVTAELSTKTTTTSAPKEIQAAVKTIEKPVPYIPQEFMDQVKKFKEKLIAFQKHLD